MQFADAPVARTRQAAQEGTLSITVGASDGLFARIAPLLGYMGSDITHCGEVGCGQVVKLINNTLLFENVAAIAEMMVVAERAGVAPAKLVEAVGLGSGNSFALQNHGLKAMVPRQFPEKAFPSPYVLKDLGYAIELAGEMGVEPRMANRAAEYYKAAVDQGLGDKYFPAIIELIDRK
jgi:3-hydroxyisobutyrate dehydrogenase-like beta-hydroxyacid dehydrogenase